MNIYTCVNHAGHYPVGVASIVVAHDEEEAIRLLDAELIKAGLRPHQERPYSLELVNTDAPVAIVLHDGDY